eukprot:g3678.t1
MLSKFVSVSVLAIAIIAIVVRINPEIVLKLPNGFIFYAIMGHTPPPYFDMSAWQSDEMKTWIRSGDVVVSVNAKSGTNWLLYMTHLIRVKGEIEKYPFTDIMLNTPWPSIVHEPGQTWVEVKEAMFSNEIQQYWNHKDYPFRVFKAHEMPETYSKDIPGATLPIKSRRDLKFIAATRNPLDQMRSFYPFFASHKAEFRRLWGDFPPVYDNKDQMMSDFLEGPFGVFLTDYNVAWYEARDEPNVHLVRFEELKEDHRGSIVDLAKFLDVELDDEQIDRIAFLSSFKEMKKIAHKFDYVLFANKENPKRTVMESGKLIRSGKTGEGHSFFTEEEKTRVYKFLDANLPKDVKKWMEL